MLENPHQHRSASGFNRFVAWICPPCVKATRKSTDVPRIAPQELCARMAFGMPIVVLDVRHPLDTFGDPRLLPGASRIRPQDLAWGKLDFVTDEPIVIYCAMQN
jgi:hypothetical protein